MFNDISWGCYSWSARHALSARKAHSCILVSSQIHVCSPVVKFLLLAMVKIRPGKFAAPEKKRKNRAIARDTNRAHLALGLHASANDLRDRTVRLRELSQEWSYPELCKLSNVAAQKMLVKSGVLKRKEKKFACWQCGRMMTFASSSSSGGGSSADILECQDCRTPNRHKLQVKNASLSFSPFWAAKCRGYESKFNLFLRVAYLHAIRIPIDAMVQLVPDKENSVHHQTITRWVDHMNLCLAFQAC